MYMYIHTATEDLYIESELYVLIPS